MNTITYLRIIIAVAIVIFVAGIYKNLIKKISSILKIQNSLQDTKIRDTAPLFQTILREAIFQLRIKDRSPILWIGHLMIFGGFVTFFIIEFLLGITKNFYCLRPILKVGLDLSGGIMLVGLGIAFVHWIIYRREEIKLIDIKSVILLFVVVISGLMSSSCRLLLDFENSLPVGALVEYSATKISGFFSFPWEEIHKWLYTVHITAAAGFIAYLPFSKLIHVVAVPLGRVVTQDKGYVNRKRAKISESLL